MQLLQDVFYTIMNALLYPVMIFLLLSLMLTLFFLGRFFSEIFYRRKNNNHVEELGLDIAHNMNFDEIGQTEKIIQSFLKDSAEVSPPIKRFLQELNREILKGKKNLDIRVENTLQENEMRTTQALDIIKIFIRLGPMAGLMGTLISIGGALLSLSIGNIQEMSNGLIIAFSTTVIGLLIGGITYVISVISEQWYNSDMRAMEFLAEAIIRECNNECCEEVAP
jgi:biopolymer transport protein ExbB/TolQ